MECREVTDRLSPFLDDELDPVTSREVSNHLESCPDCAAALDRQRVLRERLKRDLEYHRASDTLRARLKHDLRAAVVRDRPRSSFAVRPWRWLSTAAAVVAVAVGTWWLTARPDLAVDLAAREAVSGHIRSLMASHLTDVASTDQHTVKPWFAGKLDFSPPVTDFAGAGYPLVGGRLDYLQGRPVAALVYMRHRHVINVFVWPAAGAEERFTPARSVQGFHVIQGTHAGMTHRIVSDLNAEELTRFARLLAAPSTMSSQDSVLPPR